MTNYGISVDSYRERFGLRAERRIFGWIWKFACALSNPVLRVNHRLYSRDAAKLTPVFNGKEFKGQCYAVTAVFGFGCLWCFKQDERGMLVAGKNGRVVQRCRTWGKVAVTQKPTGYCGVR